MKRAVLLLLAILTALSITACKDLKDMIPTTPPAEIPATAASAHSDDLPGPAAMIEDFPVISQLPELATGCEVTSLTMVLNYNGVAADKCDIADHYLDKGEIDASDYRKVFVGDPREEEAYGCFAPVIEKTANRYLSAKKSKLKAKNISGTEFSELLSYIDNSVPVIIWGTEKCVQGNYMESWEVNGETIYWYWPEHCMVLIGYGDYQVWVADPLEGKVVTYDRILFECRYGELQKQAVVIQ